MVEASPTVVAVVGERLGPGCVREYSCILGSPGYTINMRPNVGNYRGTEPGESLSGVLEGERAIIMHGRDRKFVVNGNTYMRPNAGKCS